MTLARFQQRPAAGGRWSYSTITIKSEKCCARPCRWSASTPLRQLRRARPIGTWAARPPLALVVSVEQAESAGLRVVHYVRAREHLARMPILFLATEGADDLRWRALRAGADWFATKPLSLRELQQRVRELVRTGRPRLRALAALRREQHRLAG